VPLIIAFVSQKGGVAKSTLARGLATYAIKNNWKTKVADLDLQQKTIVLWAAVRDQHDIKPSLDIQPFATIKEAMVAAKNCDLLILDTAGKITDGATEASRYAQLLVQPTSPSSDDLHIAVLVFLAMERIGVPREKLAFALCRVLSSAEEKYARSYLASFGYRVLVGAIPEHLGYREAMRVGRSIDETGQDTLHGAVEALMNDMLRSAERNIEKKSRQTLPTSRK
jgi:chromosome partitioning protein